MVIDSPIVSGSLISNGNVTITGSLTVTGPINGALTGSVNSSSFSATASSADNFTVRGTLTAQTIVSQVVTSSVLYSSGSNIFGNSISNTQSLTGSVGITGSLTVNGFSTFNNTVYATPSNGMVNGDGFVIVQNSSTAGGAYYIKNSSNTSYLGGFSLDAGGKLRFANYTATGSVVFYAGASDLMTLTYDGKLGIGTTSPTYLLTTGISDGPRIAFPASNDRFATAIGATNVFNVGQRLDFYAGDSGANGTPLNSSFIRMSILPTGNVGIGTTSPGVLVDIQSASSTDATVRAKATGTGGAYFVTDTKISSYTGIQYLYNGTAYWYTGAINGDITSYYAFYSGASATERMRITSTGNVGIGTTSPASLSGYTVLAINNAGYGGLVDFLNNNTLQGRIGADQGGVYLQAKANIPMILYTNDTERMRITSGGDVGIGTTSPSKKLEIAGSTYINTGTLYMPSSITTRTAQIEFGNLTAGDILGIPNATSTFYLTYGSNQIHWRNDNWGEIQRYKNNGDAIFFGNVGIGTTSPTDKVSITAGALTIGFGNTDKATLQGGSGFGSLLRLYNGSGTETVRMDAGGGGGTSWITSGNVGINTTSPNHKLQITQAVDGSYPTLGTGKGALFIAGDTNLYGLYVGVNTTDGNAWMQAMRNNSATSYNIILQPAGGNVGIGTTNPEGIFHVAKAVTANLGGQIIIDNPASSTVGNYVEISFLTDAGASGSGTRNARILAVNENAGNGAANLQFHTWDGATSAERMRITSGGNVGIGTTSPSSFGTQRFLVLGNGAASQVARFTDGTNGDLFFDFPSAGVSRITAQYGTTGTLVFAKGTGSDETMRITSGGNVGIGTTSPGSKLTVNGSIESLVDSTTEGGQLILRAQSGGSKRWNIDNYSTSSVLRFFYEDDSTGANGVVAMNITSGGDVLVNTTSAINSGKLSVVAASGNVMTAWQTQTTGNNGFISFGTEGTFTERGYIYYDRAAGQTKLSATSDIRLKKDIIDAPSVIGLINSIKVRQYRWKETGSSNIGFIAQELYDVIERAVYVGEDNEDGTIKRAWGVDNATLVPYLVKAIQELKAEIDQLKSAK